MIGKFSVMLLCCFAVSCYRFPFRVKCSQVNKPTVDSDTRSPFFTSSLNSNVTRGIIASNTPMRRVLTLSGRPKIDFSVIESDEV